MRRVERVLHVTPPPGADLEQRVAVLEEVVVTRLAGELVAWL